MTQAYKNITICLPLEEKIFKMINKMEKLKSIIEAAQIVNVIHVYQTQVYFNEFSMYNFPSDEQKEDIKKSVHNILEKQFVDQFQTAREKIKLNCFFDYNPKECIIGFAKNNNTECLITLTPGKNEFLDYFHSSLSEGLVRHAPCDVLVLRTPSL